MAETFVYATYIRTTPEKLWEALTNGDFTVKYWMGYRFEGDLRAGGRMRILPPKGSEQRGDHAGEILECDPPRSADVAWSGIRVAADDRLRTP